MNRTTFVALFCTGLLGGCLGDGPGGLVSGGAGADAGLQTNCAPKERELFYADTDGDGYGDSEASQYLCGPGGGFIADDTDCDDTTALVYPGAADLCGDGLDNDCAGDGDPCLPNLVAHWGFAETAGPNVLDMSGKGNVGILQGGLLNGPLARLSFDGIDDYVEIADGAGFQLQEGTVSFWFNTAIVGIRQAVFSKDSDGRDAGGQFSFYVTPEGTVSAKLESNQNDYVITSVAPITAGQWHHVALVFGGNDGMALYVDKQLAGKDNYTGGTLRNLEPLTIGAGTDKSGNLEATPISDPFRGQISDVQVYNRRLIAEELLSLRMVSAPVGAPL